eukprot:scaffold147776_cov13-Prasinocladus_malaysianus.AAC.1
MCLVNGSGKELSRESLFLPHFERRATSPSERSASKLICIDHWQIDLLRVYEYGSRHCTY